ncbi:hypothetical protein [Pseudovibrio exalbescens]|uniref:HEPN domain-containing protein n=1 Tax=Pseudovibrio exalbescens TaxID=197461 RepID=A0A1U7JDX7_9HYPH|nr:hypothetical protein [Pseudovibrio exalbescens]OKL42905.1 hypothetical protein A3843_16235 [Pseudovibrio exalbescens]
MPNSIREMRRRAPLHYEAKADNARVVARIILDTSDAAQAQAASSIGYTGSTGIALRESFLRECSIALELVVKAVIAQKIEMKRSNKKVTTVPSSHDLVMLWATAGLPELSLEDRETLVIARRVLNWAGRYAAPKNDEREDKLYSEERRYLKDEPRPGELRIKKLRSIDWDQFDRLYKIAFEAFWSLRSEANPELS